VVCLERSIAGRVVPTQPARRLQNSSACWLGQDSSAVRIVSAEEFGHEMKNAERKGVFSTLAVRTLGLELIFIHLMILDVFRYLLILHRYVARVFVLRCW
jgi:hypothetical protein